MRASGQDLSMRKSRVRRGFRASHELASATFVVGTYDAALRRAKAGRKGPPYATQVRLPGPD
jgi:hypothetical protein